MIKEKDLRIDIKVNLVNDVYEEDDICLTNFHYKSMSGEIIYEIENEVFCKGRELKNITKRPKGMYLKDYNRVFCLDIVFIKPVGSKALLN